MGEAEQETIPLHAPPSEETDPPDFSVLRLHSSPPPSSSSLHRRRCSSCGCSGHSRKRRLPLPLPHHPAKKLFLDTPPPPDCAGTFLPLRRTLSDASPTNPSPSPGSSSNSPLPPLHPSTLRRCASDPIPIPAVPPPHSRSVSSSSAQKTGESYISKRNKMLNSWREFNQLMEKELTADEEEEQTPKPIPTEEEEEEEEVRGVQRLGGGGSQEEFEESLSVEKDGERLNIHFKCHCGNGYQFLLADGNCYYKLI